MDALYLKKRVDQLENEVRLLRNQLSSMPVRFTFGGGGGGIKVYEAETYAELPTTDVIVPAIGYVTGTKCYYSYDETESSPYWMPISIPSYDVTFANLPSHTLYPNGQIVYCSSTTDRHAAKANNAWRLINCWEAYYGA